MVSEVPEYRIATDGGQSQTDCNGNSHDQEKTKNEINKNSTDHLFILLFQIACTIVKTVFNKM